jgi:hypothetical protein
VCVVLFSLVGESGLVLEEETYFLFSCVFRLGLIRRSEKNWGREEDLCERVRHQRATSDFDSSHWLGLSSILLKILLFSFHGAAYLQHRSTIQITNI